MSEQAIPADTPGGEAVRAKRPDVTARHNARKEIHEQCVMCSLPGRLAPDWPPISRAILVDNLERQIRSTSEIIVRGSLLVNDVLLHCACVWNCERGGAHDIRTGSQSIGIQTMRRRRKKGVVSW